MNIQKKQQTRLTENEEVKSDDPGPKDKVKRYIIQFQNNKDGGYRHDEVLKHTFAEAEVFANKKKHYFPDPTEWRIVSITETKVKDV
jgi:hypothetical protein